jgi:hypothetical protein
MSSYSLHNSYGDLERSARTSNFIGMCKYYIAYQAES